ncbi:b2.5 [Tranosema rostrale ichnovirus]|nr:b2.5 [Tranosema rostrale ichnovirus]
MRSHNYATRLPERQTSDTQCGVLLCPTRCTFSTWLSNTKTVTKTHCWQATSVRNRKRGDERPVIAYELPRQLNRFDSAFGSGENANIGDYRYRSQATYTWERQRYHR